MTEKPVEAMTFVLDQIAFSRGGYDPKKVTCQHYHCGLT